MQNNFGAAPSRVRLEFLDGIRGLAALYVVLHHAALEIPVAKLPASAAFVLHCFGFGHYAVAIFIVLSGYCLMIPVAQDPAGRLRGGFIAYLKRRAIRMLPAYYAALALFLAMIAFVPALHSPADSRWDVALPAFNPGVVISHLFLVHNLRQDWIFRIVPPMWSVATEWQIYLVFPFLLFVWRRLGIVASVAAAVAIGYLPKAILLATAIDVPFNASLWYSGLFAFGMAGATVGFSADPQRQVWERRVPWATLAVLFAVTAVILLKVSPHRVRDIDHCVGAAAACLIVHCSRAVKSGGCPTIVRLLESRGVLAFGMFSYSLYLVHFPLLSMANRFLRDASWSPSARFVILISVGVPFCVLAAYMFHLAVERKFLPRPRRQLANDSGLAPALPIGSP